MIDLKQHLIDQTESQIIAKEKEAKESDEELEILSASLMVENKSLSMKDVPEDLKEDFKYSAQAIESMIAMEENRNAELKKELDILKYRKAVIESQFSEYELSR